MRYSPELLDRVSDAMDRAQIYWSRVATGGPHGRTTYEVGYSTVGQPGQDPVVNVVLVSCDTREEAIDARDTMDARARAAAALAAIGYVET